MSYNTKIRTCGVQFTKHALTIGVAVVALTIWYSGSIAMSGPPNSLGELVSNLPFGLFFAGLSYIPVYLIYDYLDYEAETITHQAALSALAVVAAGATIWLAAFSLVALEYFITGPQPDTLSASEMFGDVAAVLVILGMLSCVLFATVRVPAAIYNRRER